MKLETILFVDADASEAVCLELAKLAFSKFTTYRISPTQDGFVKRILASVPHDFFCIATKHASTYSEPYPNNTISLEGDIHKIAKTIRWMLTGEGKKDRMENTFFCSDLHFNHKNIIKYCNRPWNSGKDENGEIIVTPDDVTNMNRDLIAKWNAKVGKDDTVWFLGDFAFGEKLFIPDLRSMLNGKINIVLGNHDKFNAKSKGDFKDIVDFFYKAGFDRVYDRPVILNSYVVLSHEPMEFIGPNSPFFNIYGHVHDSANYETWTKCSCCACVERHGYAPISWKEIESKYLELNGNGEA